MIVQQVSGRFRLRTVEEGVKIYKCEEFLYGKEIDKLATEIVPEMIGGHEIGVLKDLPRIEDFSQSHTVCRDIVLEVVAHCIRRTSCNEEECVERYEEWINTNERKR